MNVCLVAHFDKPFIQHLLAMNLFWVTEAIVNTAYKITAQGFPGGAVVKNPPANAADTGSSPGPGRSHMPRSN